MGVFSALLAVSSDRSKGCFWEQRGNNCGNEAGHSLGSSFQQLKGGRSLWYHAVVLWHMCNESHCQKRETTLDYTPQV